MKRVPSIVILTFLALAAEAMSVSIAVQRQPVCSYGNGILRADVTGGTAPFSNTWSNDDNRTTISNLPLETYTVTLTNNMGAQATATQEIIWVHEYPTGDPVVGLSCCMAGSPYTIYPRQGNGS